MESKHFIHEKWNAILQTHVDASGNVNYKALKSNPHLFDEYLLQLSNTSIENLDSESEQLAFWINAYNAFTIKLILDHYPINSIKAIKNSWQKKFINIDSKLYSLNAIEHDILRNHNLPEIHFAINCASRSCPPLSNTAFSGSTLKKQLHRVTKAFLNSESNLVIKEEKLYISKLFKWYAKDFKAKGSVISFLNDYSNKTISENLKIEYLPYNWELNE